MSFFLKHSWNDIPKRSKKVWKVVIDCQHTPNMIKVSKNVGDGGLTVEKMYSLG